MTSQAGFAGNIIDREAVSSIAILFLLPGMSCVDAYAERVVRVICYEALSTKHTHSILFHALW